MTCALKHKTTKTTLPGKYYPLGATLYPDGVNFAIYSQYATEVFLHLFDTPDGEPTDIIQLKHPTKFIWHTFIKGLKAGRYILDKP